MSAWAAVAGQDGDAGRFGLPGELARALPIQFFVAFVTFC